MVCCRFALAALRISGFDRPPVRHLWRDALRDGLLSRESFRRMEMEPTCVPHALRGVDLQCLCLRYYPHARTTLAVNGLQRWREKFPSRRSGRRFGRQLDLSSFASARFVLIRRCNSANSLLVKARHCPRGKSPSRKFPIRTRRRCFTS
jgi:hypothetical protein